MKYGKINVPFKGGYKGGHVPVECLIQEKIVMDVLAFTRSGSKINGCDMLCMMQIRIGGRLYVTWHASDILTTFLEDCKIQDEQENVGNFPIEECIIVVGDDRGYYFNQPDEDSWVPTEKDMEKLLKKYVKNRRRF